MGKCCSKIKVEPALESATETDTKSRGWKRRITNSFCMGKQSAAVEPYGIQETFVKSESGQKQSATNGTCVIKEAVVKSEFGLKPLAEDDACVIKEAVVKSEFGLKPLAEDDACFIKEAVGKSEFGLKPLAEDDACVIKEAVVKSEFGLRQPAQYDACVIQEAVVKSEFGLKPLAEDDAYVIQDAVFKSEFGLKQLADDACVIQDVVVKSEFGLKQPAENDACVMQEAVVKSESQHSQGDTQVCTGSQIFGFDELPRVAQTPKMNFAIYLLPSSPPASNHGLSCLADSPEAAKNGLEESQEIADKEYNYERCMNGVNLGPNVNNRENLRKHMQGIKPIIVKRDAITSDSETSETSADSGRVTPVRPSSSRSSRVSFADDKGFALATVHIITEPSSEPPCIAADENWSFTNVIEPPYKLAFSQPAADYMGFREKVDRCRVSLENVILSGYHVQGTIKVKNICFEKRVFVRVTFDSWITCQDVEAKYVQPYAGNTVHNFDTFSFQFEIDTRSDTNKNVQFAVCFETPTGQNWDNNRGANYEIIPHENADCLEDIFFKG